MGTGTKMHEKQYIDRLIKICNFKLRFGWLCLIMAKTKMRKHDFEGLSVGVENYSIRESENPHIELCKKLQKLQGQCKYNNDNKY